MSPVKTAALEMLRSFDFFAQLRGTLHRAGLPGEERIGVGVFFTMISRFLPNPLRLAIQEQTDGGAKYVVRKVSKLLPPGTIHGIFSEQGWSRFAEDPAQKVAYVPEWGDRWVGGSRIEISENRVTRILQTKRDGRVVETPQKVERRFVCISPEYPPEPSNRLRWLTIKLPTPTSPGPNGTMPLDDKKISSWIDVQRLLQERAKLTIVLPDWADVFIEHVSQDDRAARHLPAFLQAWKTMSLLGSFRRDEGCENSGRRELLEADFEDLAVTSSLLRGVFREGHRFPSVDKVFDRVFPVGTVFAVIHPLSGKGIRYTRQEEREPVRWEPLV
jgi:hypothetical protein